MTCPRRPFVLALLGLCVLPSTWGRSAERAQPNILLILADDLGFSDLGCYGSEIRTPHLDQLAQQGLRFTQCYNTARCWPTRASLLTGYYPQQIRRDALPGIPSGMRGVRPPWARLLPEQLTALGYRSYHSGKWHIDGEPLQGGFSRSYNLADHGRYFHPRVHLRDDKRLPAVKPGSGYYSTTAIADHVIECLQEHARDHTTKAFFHYVCFTAPHFPLHALPEDIARYRDVYQKGWDEIRKTRWSKQQTLGFPFSHLSEVEREVGPPYPFPDAYKRLGSGEVTHPLPWRELTKQQQAFQAMKMAIHAAMIDRMDQEIGRILQQLRKMNSLDNTLILFLSDNGATAEIMVRDDGHDPTASPGSAGSHLCLGPGWSNVANTPFRRHKTWVHEGGICTPLIVHWPKKIRTHGELRHVPAHVIDFVPTLLAAAGGKPLATFQEKPVPPLPGKNLLPVLLDNQTIKRDRLWWLHEGNRAYRQGDWKLVAAKGQPWELYDLSKDRTEQQNLAKKQQNRVSELEKQWQQSLDQFTELARSDLPKRSP